ncbi:unnamed protein product [Prorocentrum cordatum]|uniref:Protein xylosyltransferase n=1 Tax=Prorocentrum cordatum TaxID=2364126 RepID=A0ABN9U9V3_9DINO|nr:unnamed protein product [Polarella glacialis]
MVAILPGRLIVLLQYLRCASAVTVRRSRTEPAVNPQDYAANGVGYKDGIRYDEIVSPAAALGRMWGRLWRTQSREDYMIMNLSSPGMCFPTPLGGVVRENWKLVEGNIERGRRMAAEVKVVFAGLVRDAGESIIPAYVALKVLARQFKDYHFFVLENDSRDQTKRWLRVASERDPRFECKSENLMLGNDRGVEPSRFQRMAALRNRLLDWIGEFVQQSSGWDLIVMVDFDIFKYGPFAISSHSFFSLLGRKETARREWDMVCANGLYKTENKDVPYGMYDCFAFRTKKNDTFNAGDCPRDKEQGMKLWAGYDLVPVHSCFGGMAVYRSEALFQCRYDPGVYDCEHVPLHQCMRKHGSENRMFMDTMLTTAYVANGHGHDYDDSVHQECLSGSWAEIKKEPSR